MYLAKRFFSFFKCHDGYIRIKEEDYITYRVTIDAELYRRVAHAESDANRRSTKTQTTDDCYYVTEIR